MRRNRLPCLRSQMFMLVWLSQDYWALWHAVCQCSPSVSFDLFGLVWHSNHAQMMNSLEQISFIRTGQAHIWECMAVNWKHSQPHSSTLSDLLRWNLSAHFRNRSDGDIVLQELTNQLHPICASFVSYRQWSVSSFSRALSIPDVAGRSGPIAWRQTTDLTDWLWRLKLNPLQASRVTMFLVLESTLN